MHYNAEVFCIGFAKSVIRGSSILIYHSTRGILFHHNNAPAHTSSIAMAIILNCEFKIVVHPPYSSDLAPFNSNLFSNMKKALAFSANNNEVMDVERFFGTQEKDFFLSGIKVLQHHWSFKWRLC